MLVVWTIGHSSRTLDTFLALLRWHGVQAIADVRRYPGSRRHPHFAREALEASLPQHGVRYRHFPGLGGRRSLSSTGSKNTGWQSASFRAYADHMESVEFQQALAALLELAAEARTAVMCAEARWWECHRQLIADALVARGVEVRHILAPQRAEPHTLTSFARVEGETVSYPGLL